MIQVVGADDVLRDPPVAWGIERLTEAVGSSGLAVASGAAPEEADLVLELRRASTGDGIEGKPESYRLRVQQESSARRASVAATDERGFAYALSELVERFRAQGLDGLAEEADETSIAHAPIRGMCRSFASVHHDLPWFRDRSFWPDYLDHLTTQRFNRFHLALGMQYNYGWGAMGPQVASDNYLCFPYPFLFEVPGHEGVRVQGVDEPERERNLAALRFIAHETRRRGMGFQLGLWNHAYDYGESSPHWYPVLGIGRETHANYCAAAVAHLLEQVPEIDGVTFRVHYEGGIADSRLEFWDQMFGSISGVGRPIDVDLHSKGVDHDIAAAAQKPNLRPTLSAKYAAEHLGLPYHQASIRPHEAPMAVPEGLEMMGTAEFSRRYTRYGYADFLSEDRTIDLAFRVWPGTQRLLLWGDPVFAAGYAHASTFGGARGLEVSEPLSFKGRKGTGQVGAHDPYVDDELRLDHDDWRKHAYTYLLWGRLLHDPDTDPEVWRRHLRAEYGPAAAAVESGLGALSRVLPLVTMTHMPSASNNTFWPEMYTDLPVSAWLHASVYSYDTPSPTQWETASPLDPTMFYDIGTYADHATAGSLDGRYTPLEVAAWLDSLGTAGGGAIDALEARAGDEATPQRRRTLVDLRVLQCLAEFFAGKFRAATEYALHRRMGGRASLQRAIDVLDDAHAAYRRIPDIVEGVYADGIPFGDRATEDGHWSDRLTAMQDDLRMLLLELERLPDEAASVGDDAVRRSGRWRFDGELVGPDRFVRGESVEVRLVPADPSTVSGAVLCYRRADQSETFRSVEMVRAAGEWVGSVPGEYTDTTYPLIYFAEIHRDGEHPIIHPGLDDTISNQPYVLLHSDRYGDR